MAGTDLGDKLTRLAEGVLDELLTPNEGQVKPSMEQRIDAIKCIGALHLGLRRLSGKSGDDPDEPGGLPAMRERMRAATEKSE